MLGALFGDIVGSVYEFRNTKDYNFQLLNRSSAPTDDSYMTLAVAQALMTSYGKSDEEIRASVAKCMRMIGRAYPYAGYGGMFYKWLKNPNIKAYNSFGNGSGMRVSPAGWLYPTLEETNHVARLTAEVTHNHPEGIKGAQAVASAIFLARTKASKKQIADYITETFGYNFDWTLDELRPDYQFYVDCQRSVPVAIKAFLEGRDYEDVIRKAVSMGGDSDTIACMAGGIAEAYYGMPEKYKEEVFNRLDEPMCRIIKAFYHFYHDLKTQPENPFVS